MYNLSQSCQKDLVTMALINGPSSDDRFCVGKLQKQMKNSVVSKIPDPDCYVIVKIRSKSVSIN